MVAMFLAASMAAGVLMGDISALESTSSDTSEQAADTILNRVEILNANGDVNRIEPAENPSKGELKYTETTTKTDNSFVAVTDLSFLLKLQQGADRVNPKDIIVIWKSNQGAEFRELASGAVSYTVERGPDTLTDESRVVVNIALNPTVSADGSPTSSFNPLEPGDSVIVSYQLPSGTKTRAELIIPSNVQPNQTVRLS
jgi:archaellin